MGRRARPRPERLAEKLLQIRMIFGLSQSGMVARMELGINYSEISAFEIGTREPSLLILLAYAKLANVCLDVLANDEIDLPERLPFKKTVTRHLAKR